MAQHAFRLEDVTGDLRVVSRSARGFDWNYWSDEESILFGTGSDVRMRWDTSDANANEFLIQLPAGGAVNVPVIAIGQSIFNLDLGLYNGVVDPRVALFGVGAVTTGPVLEFRKARGTIAAPTVVTTGDDMGTIDFYGAVAAGEYVRGASIRADMAGTIATTRGPGTLNFLTATDAAPSVLTSALLLGADQSATFGGAALPVSNNNAALGSATLSWADLFLATGAVLNFNNGNFTVTHSAGLLTFSGDVTVSGTFTPAVVSNATISATTDFRLGSATAGAATSTRKIVIKTTGIADNTATSIITVTVPNANHAAAIKLTFLSSNGGADAFESSRTAHGVVVLARTTGVATVATAVALTNADIATVAAGATHTLAYALTGMTGAVGATQTFSIQVTIDDTGNLGSNQLVTLAEVINAETTGVTIAAA